MATLWHDNSCVYLWTRREVPYMHCHINFAEAQPYLTQVWRVQQTESYRFMVINGTVIVTDMARNVLVVRISEVGWQQIVLLLREIVEVQT